MDDYDTVEMASGGLALVLEPTATWRDFPGLADKWIQRLHAELHSKPLITSNECIATVTVSGGEFWITYDDFQSSIQLEPHDPSYNAIVLRLQAELRGSA